MLSAWQPLFAGLVLVLIFWGLVRNHPPDALMLGGLVLVTLAGLVSPSEALSGFSNMSVLTIGALYVVAAALRETGALDIIGQWALGKAKSERGALIHLSGSVTLMSAFMNNTPIVAMFIPLITQWCRRHGFAASKLLIPLSYLCILGGTCTLIGTSTNLVVNGLMEEAVKTSPELGSALSPLGFFELGRVGLPFALMGVLYLIFIGQKQLPTRTDLIEHTAETSHDYLVNLRVLPDCRALTERTVQEAGLRRLPGLFLVEISRSDQIIAPVGPDQVLKAGDILTFTGVVSTIVDLEKISGLVPVGDHDYEVQVADRRRRVLCEAVISPSSPSIGKTIRDADFRAQYNAVVIAVHRGQERLRGKVGDMKLRPGDTLLLQAGPHFARANRNNPDFLLISGLEDTRAIRHDKAVLSLVLLVLLIGLLVSGRVSVVVVALLVAGLMVLGRCIDVADARRSVDWQTLITIASAFGLSKALANSGFSAAVAGFFVEWMGRFGPYGLLAAVYLVTILFTETITNNAAAAIVFPFAVAVAVQADVNPRPLVMAVAYASSASFITPLGYHTNLMVFGPGGYRFTDFVRIGLPLSLLLMASSTVLIPLIWKF